MNEPIKGVKTIVEGVDSQGRQIERVVHGNDIYKAGQVLYVPLTDINERTESGVRPVTESIRVRLQEG
jgi:hypothetical protein